jgi:hypothetical protein
MKEEVNKWMLPPQPNQAAIEKQTQPLLDRAASFDITSEDHYTASLTVVQQLDRAITTVGDTFNPFCTGLRKMHLAACELRDRFLKPLEQAKSKLMDRRVAYRQEQEAAKRKLDAKAAALLQQQQKAELEKAAKLAAKQGDKETAVALREQKETVPLPYVSSGPAVPKQEGVYTRDYYHFLVENEALVPREYCSPDQKKIRQAVEAFGVTINIPGVRAWKETKEHSRSAP